MDTIVARLTPAMPAAIATIAISGPNAVALAEQFAGLYRHSLSIGSIRFGTWRLDLTELSHPVERTQAYGEQVVVTRPGEQSVEVHCHGGVAVCKALLDELSSAGCHILSADQWPSVFACPLSRAAEEELQRVVTDRAAAVLLDQMNGALRRSVEHVRKLITCHSLPPITSQQSFASGLGPTTGDAAHELTELLRWAEFGLHLSRPWRAVLVGPPNVGKSSLLNAIAGTRQSIVHSLPGTTRDWIDWPSAVDGWPVVFTDTAGIRSPTGAVEEAGIEQSLKQLRQADLAIIVVDARIGWTEEHARLLQIVSSRHLIVSNKVDLLGGGNLDGSFVACGPLSTCAVDGRGIDTLLGAIARKLVPDSPAEGTAVPFRRDHVVGLRECLDIMESGESVVAAERLSHLLGESP